MGVAILRTRLSIGTINLNTSIFIGIEVHSVAFTSVYFWIIPALLIGSFIGVSQTEDRLPRILARFQEDLERHFKDTPEIQALQDSIQKLGQDPKRQEDRFYTGGIYSWQGAMRSTNSAAESSPGESKPPTVLARLSPLVRLFNVWILPILIGMVPTLFGAFTSGLVPPQGFNCRVWGEAAFSLPVY